ncbi:MAG: hypothetical protein JOY72_07790 [Actinobacteria bacterium]|nr:hypothetical protein [Actinomycetota bacterium]
MTRDLTREEAFESRWEAAPAVVSVILLQALLAFVSLSQHWKLAGLPWWVWLVSVGPELLLLGPLAFDRPRHQLEQAGMRRLVGLTLLGFVNLSNLFVLVALLVSLVHGDEKSGGQLLLKGAVVWGTNVIAFGLVFWAIDRGGPSKRIQPDPPFGDFLFPQMDNPKIAPPDWYPQLADYIYVSFTNAIAFSPTDTMPLSRLAKWLMLAESAISAVTVLLVAARAVNIFS